MKDDATVTVDDARLEELARQTELGIELAMSGVGKRHQRDVASALRELQRRRAGDAETETLRRERDAARAKLEAVRAYCTPATKGMVWADAILHILDAPAPAPALFCDVDPSIRVGIRDWILDALEGDDTFEGMCVRDWLNGLR